MNHDIRVIFIKFADRLHNMRTLDAKSEVSQRTIALETMHLYAPLAHRLGVQKIKTELENLARIYSVEEGETITFLDLMRRGIQEKYQLGEQDNE